MNPHSHSVQVKHTIHNAQAQCVLTHTDGPGGIQHITTPQYATSALDIVI